MSNAIDLVVGKDVEGQIKKLMTELGEVDAKITAIGESAVKMNTALGVKDTASLTKLTAENEKLNKKIQELTGSSAVLETKLANLAAAQSKATKAATDASIAEEKLLAATNKNTVATENKTKAITEETIAQREANKQATINATINNEQVGAYKRLEAQYQKTAQKALDLGAANKQNTEEYKRLVKESQELGQRLKSVDSDVGKHTRNVGNYSSSWNGLGNSINQLTREAPAFANSLQTGFMALSNNIPILTDELGVLIAKNKALKDDGKPTESMLKTVAGAFFSWQTAISLGVTILTVYGAKIIDTIFGLTELEKKQKAYNDSILEANTQTTDEIAKLQSLISIVNDNTESHKNQKLAYDEIKKTLPGLKSMTVEQAISTGELKVATDLYIASLIQKNLVEITAKEIAQDQSSLDKKKTQSTKERMNGFVYFMETITLHQAAGLEIAEKANKKTDKLEQEAINNRKKNLKTQFDEYLNTMSKLSKFTTAPTETKPKKDKTGEENAKKDEENAKNKYARELSDLERSKELIQDKYDAEEQGTRMRISLSNELALSQVNIIEAQYNEEVRLANNNADLIKIADNHLATARENILKENGKRIIAEQERIHKKIGEIADEEKYGVDTYFMPMDEVQSWVAEWNRIQKDKADKDKQNAADKKKIDEEVANYLMSFGSEFASKAGLSETFNILSGNVAKFGENASVTFVAVAEAAQEMFNVIAESSAANYDAEYARLDAQKEAAIKNAGDSTTAKEKIEADYEKKKKEIQLREFKAKQKITIANIAIDTAQAIVSTYAQVPKYDYGVSATTLAFIIAGLGAAQIAMVATQKPPAYADGTDNHSGGLMLVNDGAGSNFQEKVILPSGKVIRPQGRNVLMDAPKGTKVLNHEQQLFEMLQSNNISMSSQQASGLTYDEMNEIFQNNFANIKTQNTIFDKNGFQSYVRNGNSITKSNSNRSQSIGISV